MTTGGPGQSPLLLAAVALELDSRGIGYVVIGAMAAAVHGVVRASLDADALVDASVQRLADLSTRLESRGWRVELRRGGIDDPIGAVLTVVDGHGNRVDLLAGLRGAEPATFQRALEVPFEGVALRVAGLEDFVAMKAYAGGPRDLDDARRVLAVAAGGVDEPLVRRIAASYGRECVAVLDSLLRER